MEQLHTHTLILLTIGSFCAGFATRLLIESLITRPYQRADWLYRDIEDFITKP